MIEINKKAPNFKAETDNNGIVELDSLKGRWVVLYFYPKDNTSGCTKEACSFRDNYERINSINTTIIGVSPDSVASHNKFKEKHNLNFSLIADANKEICNLYGVIGEKKMYGRTYLGVVRSTFLIDPKGNIAHIWRNVKVDGHVDDIIAKLKDLQKND